jgi:hypothetical protein
MITAAWRRLFLKIGKELKSIFASGGNVKQKRIKSLRGPSRLGAPSM